MMAVFCERIRQTACGKALKQRLIIGLLHIGIQQKEQLADHIANLFKRLIQLRITHRNWFNLLVPCFKPFPVLLGSHFTQPLECIRERFRRELIRFLKNNVIIFLQEFQCRRPNCNSGEKRRPASFSISPVRVPPILAATAAHSKFHRRRGCVHIGKFLLSTANAG